MKAPKIGLFKGIEGLKVFKEEIKKLVNKGEMLHSGQ